MSKGYFFLLVMRISKNRRMANPSIHPPCGLNHNETTQIARPDDPPMHSWTFVTGNIATSVVFAATDWELDVRREDWCKSPNYKCSVLSAKYLQTVSDKTLHILKVHKYVEYSNMCLLAAGSSSDCLSEMNFTHTGCIFVTSCQCINISKKWVQQRQHCTNRISLQVAWHAACNWTHGSGPSLIKSLSNFMNNLVLIICPLKLTLSKNPLLLSKKNSFQVWSVQSKGWQIYFCHDDNLSVGTQWLSSAHYQLHDTERYKSSPHPQFLVKSSDFFERTAVQVWFTGR